jgi:predicted CXXCH cytochrome family protein
VLKLGVLRELAALAALAALLPAYAGDSRTPLPVIEKAKAGTQCVAEPAVMRREHPDMLKHQRDDTVHGGIRGAKASLKACIDCHASPASGSVTKSETNFCVSCHSYTAVRIDCFECHATKPQATARGPAAPDSAVAASGGDPSSAAIASLPIARQR